jgi:hypothetical protein
MCPPNDYILHGSNLSEVKHMALIYCPECGHEVSVNAIACPGCGRPIAPTPVVEEQVVVAPPVEKSMPPWAYALIGISAVSLILAAIVFFRQGPEDQSNLNVNVAARRTGSTAANDLSRETRTSTVGSTDAPTVSVPSTSVPSTSIPSTGISTTQTSSVPPTTSSQPVAPPPDRGKVLITAKIAPRTGSPRAVSGTRFYLLEKDVQSLLAEARVEPIEGNDLAGSLGLAAVNPGRYADFQRRAMKVIAAKAKSAATTGANGSASFDGVKPDQYYLFAIARVGSGFAFWNAPVSVSAGENLLDLSPQTVTEIEVDGLSE